MVTAQSRDAGVFADSGNELLWSAASTWELAIKLQLGKLRLPHGGEDHVSLAGFVARTIVDQSLTPLGVEHAHAARVATLPALHRDPFDRLLVAQALVERVPLLTADAELSAYGIECLSA